MIIQVRGTSGSGKSTIVRSVMALYPVREPIHEGRRKQPWGYHLRQGDEQQHAGRLYVPGHYEIECGGMDTLPRLAEAMPDVLVEHELGGRDVLMEGLLASEDVRHLLALREKMRHADSMLVIQLTTPIEECLAAIRERRARRGNSNPLSEKNTRNRVATIKRACARLTMEGVHVEDHDRAGALARVRSLLGV